MVSVMLKISDVFFFGTSSGVPAFKVRDFVSDFESSIGSLVTENSNTFCSPYCYPLITLQGVN